jgi:hypothetical protein
MNQVIEPKSLFLPEKAERIAKMMKENDPEWDYVVVHNENGFSFIEVYDEENYLIGKV